jgi:squalene monooxygenase
MVCPPSLIPPPFSSTTNQLHHIVDEYLRALQRGCFRYFQLGMAAQPTGMLGGLIKSPSVLFRHFFTVAFLSLWLVLADSPLYLLPVALGQCALVFWTACVVIFPYMLVEAWC